MFRWLKQNFAFADRNALYIHWPLSVCIARDGISMKLGKSHWQQIWPKPKPFDEEAFRAAFMRGDGQNENSR
jgi:hypothetical protein